MHDHDSRRTAHLRTLNPDDPSSPWLKSTKSAGQGSTGSIRRTTLSPMAMGTRRKRRRQHGLWISAAELPTTAAHPFYRRVNAMLDERAFDAFVEGACRSFYADTMGRPSLTPGMYFRLLLVGYFEGI